MLRGLRWVALACLATRPAVADPITSRDYAIDFYDGVAIGNTAMVGMGGAGAAHVLGSAGTLTNPSAAAVRRTTDTDRWSWDYHLDFLTGRFSTDYDNNGATASKDSGASLVTFGLAGRYGKWALATTATIQTAPIAGSSPELTASAYRFKVALSRYFPSLDLAIGVGAQTVMFQILYEDETELFTIQGGGVIAGATWLPSYQNLRVGVAFEGEIHGGDVTTETCDPENCQGYILPDHVESPGRLIAGLAYRWAPTAWNQLVGGKFRDEQSITAAADVVVTGDSPEGYGIEAFGMQELQRSGRKVVVSVRGGAESEVIPGRFRARAGSYWEPSRFDGVPGRLHGTFGADLRVFEFRAWGPRRGRISVTADIAARYRNLALSVGLWN
jgi:hypothetical protein